MLDDVHSMIEEEQWHFRRSAEKTLHILWKALQAHHRGEWMSVVKEKTMKKFLIIILAFAQVQLFAGEPTNISSSFENFVVLFREATFERQSEMLRPFFSDTITWQHADGTVESLRFEEMVSKLASVGDPEELLRSLAKGFVFTGDDREARFTALHNDLRYGNTVEIKANALRLRKFPSTSAPVVCLLERGLSGGMTDPDRPEVIDENGTCWSPLIIMHPDLGSVRGYAAADYIEVKDLSLPAGMNIVLCETGWKITGFTYL